MALGLRLDHSRFSPPTQGGEVEAQKLLTQEWNLDWNFTACPGSEPTFKMRPLFESLGPPSVAM
jgi:hypothetical protein